MFAEVMREDAYRAYRIRMEALLEIPADASDLEVHRLIESGFPASHVMALCTLGAMAPSERDLIIPLRTLKSRSSRGQRLTISESDRLFRFIHITAMAESLFGDKEKARRWLSKSKNNFLGSSPMAMLSTTQGTRAVEHLLLQVAEGYSF